MTNEKARRNRAEPFFFALIDFRVRQLTEIPVAIDSISFHNDLNSKRLQP
jgi:hypothetical protein